MLLSAAFLVGAWHSAASEHPPTAPPLFDPDPNHIWNQTFACLLVRQAPDGTQPGAEDLDPLLWQETRHLLIGDPHRRAIACLDEFLRTHAENAVQYPLKRAVFQRDLWAVFDWASAGVNRRGQRRELEVRLAEAIRRLALTLEQIRALPDTYAAAVAAGKFAAAYDPRHPQQPFLPPDLFHGDGPWVCLSAYSDDPTAPGHFTGRSRFLIFMRLPEGRDATLAYIRKLQSSSEPALLPDASGPQRLLNLALPQFPAGTEFALVRQAILIDDRGNLSPTALTESVQLRVYHAVTPGSQYMNYMNGPASHDQDFFEFRMIRSELFSQPDGGLVAVRPGEKIYATVFTQGMDPFEANPPYQGQRLELESCRGCHADSGIHSVTSRLRWMQRSQVAGAQANQDAPGDAIRWETDVTIARKQRQPEFNLLQKQWRASRD